MFLGATPGRVHVPVSNYRDTDLSTLNTFPYVPAHSTQSMSSATTPLSPTSDRVHFDYSHVGLQQDAGIPSTPQFQFDLRASSPVQGFVPLAGQSSLQGDHVLYYFEHVRRTQYPFAGNSVTNVTYSVSGDSLLVLFHLLIYSSLSIYQMIVQEPQGAVTNAVCALANLHFKRMRVARGIEPPDANPDQSIAKYFHDEAYFQLVSAKQVRGHYNESDAIAALHLVSFSLLSGGATDWRPVLTVALDWLGQTGLVADESPRLAMFNMSFASQCALKIVMVRTFRVITVLVSMSLTNLPLYSGWIFYQA